jgi:hypothetical protein
MSYYAWPASGLTADDMRLLFQARQRSQPKIPINQLIAQAIRQTFNPTTQATIPPAPTITRKEP